MSPSALLSCPGWGLRACLGCLEMGSSGPRASSKGRKSKGWQVAGCRAHSLQEPAAPTGLGAPVPAPTCILQAFPEDPPSGGEDGLEERGLRDPVPLSGKHSAQVINDTRPSKALS